MSISKPEVVVVTRTKNRNVLLRRALNSVASQTYKSLIHVVVNDGGDTATVESVISEFSHNIKLIHNKDSVGLTKALNQGIVAAKTKYVAILDDDDTWSPLRLEKAITYLQENLTSSVVVRMEIVKERLEDESILELGREAYPESEEGELSLYKQFHKNYIANGSVLYTRSIYDELGGYDESLPTAEDWEFGIRLLMAGDVGILRNEEPLVFYHQRPDGDGDIGNSGIARVRTQEIAINTIRNRFLRDDLQKKSLGVGYIMNSTVYDLQSVVRLESHINRTSEQVQDCMKENLKSNGINLLTKIRNIFS